jgi:nickel superoxide dismutase
MVPFSILNQTTEEPMMKNFRKVMLLITFTVFGSVLVLPQPAHAHCQIPCGIYDDHARVQSMLEDAATVEKSAKLIAELADKSGAQPQNQLVRWVMNKEKHAEKIISTISDYFLTQRVKPSQKDYAERLIKHHAVIIAAMKAKQNADVKYAKNLKESIEALSSYYPEHKQ